jgi:uncharacterized protein with HEPN domain
MHLDDNIRIQHIIEAAENIENFISGRCKNDLHNDKLLLLALTRAIEIIGEASARITQETKANMPEIPWAIIVGMRNRLVHAYFDINVDIIWLTATKNVPALVAMLKKRGF